MKINLGELVLFPPTKAGIKKTAWIIVFIAVAYYAYTLLLSPPKVTIFTYKQIRQGMSVAEVDSMLGTGLLRIGFRSVGDALESNKQTKGGEILDEFETVSNQINKDARDAIAKGVKISTIRGNDVSKEGMLDSSNTFIPARKLRQNIYITRKSGGSYSINFDVEYEFHEYSSDITVANNPCKLLRNGIVAFNPALVGFFETWKGNNGRTITILFTGSKSSYWSYQGPAEDFAGLPPLQLAKASVAETPVHATKNLESVKKIEQPKTEATLPDLQKIRSALVTEYDRKLPVWTVGATVKLYRRGVGITGTVEAITASNVVLSEQDTREEIPFADMDAASRCRFDPVFRGQVIDQAARQQAETSSTAVLPAQQQPPVADNAGQKLENRSNKMEETKLPVENAKKSSAKTTIVCDKLVLINGEILEGDIIAETDKSFSIRVPENPARTIFSTRVVSKPDIKDVVRATPEQKQAAAQKILAEQKERNAELRRQIELVDFTQNNTGGSTSIQHPKGSRISSTLFVGGDYYVNYNTTWKLGFSGSFRCRIVQLAGYKEDKHVYTLRRSTEGIVEVPNAGMWKWKISEKGSGFKSPVTVVELWVNNTMLIRNQIGKDTPDEAIVRNMPALGYGFNGEVLKPLTLKAEVMSNTSISAKSSGTQTLQPGWNKCPWCGGNGRDGINRCSRCGGSGRVKVE